MKRIILILTALVMAVTATAHAADAWTCINGHGGNTGNFCYECGAPRPESADAWTCVNGHGGNTGNFCSECGAPRPEPADEWTCVNGHGGNTGNFCYECGAPRPQTGMAEDDAVYDDPFPEDMYLYAEPFEGTAVDHQIAIEEYLSHTDPSDAHYVVYESSGTASDDLAWDLYAGADCDLYLLYRPDGQEVYAYAFTFECNAARRTEWAKGALFPSTLTAVASVLWVESGEDNDNYGRLLDRAAKETDYESVKRLIRSLDPSEYALWFSHGISMFREETGSGKDRYWVVFHNTGN